MLALEQEKSPKISIPTSLKMSAIRGSLSTGKIDGHEPFSSKPFGAWSVGSTLSLRSTASIETKPWIKASLRGRAVAVEIDFASGVGLAPSNLQLFVWVDWAGPIKFWLAVWKRCGVLLLLSKRWKRQHRLRICK